jgi:hypothetical protein
LKLIVGTDSIETYECACANKENSTMNSCSINFLWKDSEGAVQPAIVEFEASDFEEGGGGMIQHANEYHTPDFSLADHEHAPAGSLPSGIVCMWSGLLVNIPSGWSLCDGSGTTPDLRDKFILSVGASEEPGTTGGSTTLTHSGTDVASHSTGEARSGKGAVTLTPASHNVTQPTDHENVLPPFYKLAFIIKD